MLDGLPPCDCLASAMEAFGHTVLDDGSIGPGTVVVDRELGESVTSVEVSGGPADPSEIHIRVLIEISQLLTQISRAIASLSTTGFSIERLSSVASKPLSQRSESISDVVCDAIGGGSRVVGIEILVDVEHKVCDGAVGIGHQVESSSGTIGDEGCGRSPVVPWKEAYLRSGTSVTDSSYRSLD